MSGIPDPGRASKAVEIVAQPTGSMSPFDCIRNVTPEGREFWSARDLMPLLGYEKWERFADAIDRAKISAHHAGYDVATQFPAAGKVVGIGSGAKRSVQDYHLSRYACYLVALNGDPRKLEIAAAHTYFVIKTREAETVRTALTEDEIIHQALTLTVKRVEVLTAKVAELEPKAEFYDDLMDADGCYSMNATAKAIGWGRNVMMRELRRAGVLTGQNLPYQRYAHHFKVVPRTYSTASGETRCTATTFVLASGVDFVRKKLAGALELAVSE